MDINLPKMSGVECTRQLKALLPETQIVMLTVYDDSDRIFQALQMGAHGYLLKRGSADEILQAIQDVHRGGAPMSVLAGHYWQNLACSVRVKVIDGRRDAALLFRCRLPAVGYDAQEGYFVGIIPGTGKLVLGSTDGASWRELSLVDAGVQSGREYLLSVTARGPEIVLALDGKEIMRKHDAQYTGGSVGLRVVDTHAAFSDLTIQ